MSVWLWLCCMSKEIMFVYSPHVPLLCSCQWFTVAFNCGLLALTSKIKTCLKWVSLSVWSLVLSRFWEPFISQNMGQTSYFCLSENSPNSKDAFCHSRRMSLVRHSWPLEQWCIVKGSWSLCFHLFCSYFVFFTFVVGPYFVGRKHY